LCAGILQEGITAPVAYTEVLADRKLVVGSWVQAITDHADLPQGFPSVLSTE